MQISCIPTHTLRVIDLHRICTSEFACEIVWEAFLFIDKLTQHQVPRHFPQRLESRSSLGQPCGHCSKLFTASGSQNAEKIVWKVERRIAEIFELPNVAKSSDFRSADYIESQFVGSSRTAFANRRSVSKSCAVISHLRLSGILNRCYRLGMWLLPGD